MSAPGSVNVYVEQQTIAPWRASATAPQPQHGPPDGGQGRLAMGL
jgi:hypothetical protein